MCGFRYGTKYRFEYSLMPAKYKFYSKRWNKLAEGIHNLTKVATQILNETLTTLTEVFPWFFLSCKANARVKLAKTGHGPHSSKLVVICVVLLLFALFYTGCNRRNGPDFGRVFLRSYYTDITQNTYIQSSMVTEILAREVWNFDSYYSLIDYQIHIETGRNMWFL